MYDFMFGQVINYEDLFEDLDFMVVNNYYSFEVYDWVLSNYDCMWGFKKGMYWFFEIVLNNFGGGVKGNIWFFYQFDGSMYVVLWMNYVFGGQGVIFWFWWQYWAGQEMLYGFIFNVWGKLVVNYDDLK